MQYTSGIGLRRSELPGDDGGEGIGWQKSLKEVCDGCAIQFSKHQPGSAAVNNGTQTTESPVPRSGRGMSVLKVPRTQAHPQPSTLKVRHQLNQPGLRFLLNHGGSFNGPDGSLGFILRGLGEGVDVIENIGGSGNAERFSASKMGMS